MLLGPDHVQFIIQLVLSLIDKYVNERQVKVHKRMNVDQRKIISGK